MAMTRGQDHLIGLVIAIMSGFAFGLIVFFAGPELAAAYLPAERLTDLGMPASGIVFISAAAAYILVGMLYGRAPYGAKIASSLVALSWAGLFCLVVLAYLTVLHAGIGANSYLQNAELTGPVQFALGFFASAFFALLLFALATPFALTRQLGDLCLFFAISVAIGAFAHPYLAQDYGQAFLDLSDSSAVIYIGLVTVFSALLLDEVHKA